jgi:hypothetical protein
MLRRIWQKNAMPAAQFGKLRRKIFSTGSDRRAPRVVGDCPQFEPGQSVRALNINPVTHTRLTRYVRGKLGTIARDHGDFALADIATGARIVGPGGCAAGRGRLV